MQTSYAVALFLFLLTFCRTLSTDQDIVNVKYSRDPVSAMKGQSLTLKCTVEYNEDLCGGLQTMWCFLSEDLCQPLINPDKYLLHVNETKMLEKTGFRHQDVFITFKHLLPNNTGTYQCNGKCAPSGASAMGRYMNITVTENNYLNNISPNRSGRSTANIILLILSGLIFS